MDRVPLEAFRRFELPEYHGRRAIPGQDVPPLAHHPGGTILELIDQALQVRAEGCAPGRTVVARIRSFASIAGWYHDAKSVAPFYGGAQGTALRLERGSRALEAYTESGAVALVPAYEPDNDRAGMFFELDYYANPRRGAIPAWKNEMAEMSWLFWLTFDGLRAAREVRVPTVMIHGDDCVLPDHAKKVYADLQGPKQLEWAPGSQIDFYDQPAQVNNAVPLVAEHFRSTLSADRATRP
jgi:hypothetical protein